MSFIGDLFGGDSADASSDAAEIQARYQREALQYLQESEALPRQYREAALSQLGALFGLGGPNKEQLLADLGSRPRGAQEAEAWDRRRAEILSLPDAATSEEALASLRSTPIYQAIMSGQQAGEDAILRQAGATGGLRSGNVQDALSRYAGDLEGRALLESVGGLQGMAATPSNVNQVAALQQGIGTTLAQGIIGGAQAQQAGIGQGIGTGLGIADLIWSDMRLKDNIKLIGERNGHNWYSWAWNEAASTLGLTGSAEGVLADEVEVYRPDAVIVVNGYKSVDYAALGV
jgi:hypothetical protein